jgi:tetratricopeptide (TPR) repeat protein
MKRFAKTVATVVIFGAALMPALAQAAQEQHDQHGPSPNQVGTVAFETSCAPAVQADFNRAVALLHSFWFPEAIAVFEGVLKSDPNCAIAYWGIAVSRWGNPFAGQRTPSALTQGKLDIDQGLTTGSPTPREKGYIAAAAELFRDNSPATQRPRVLAYSAAMERLSRENPQDLEATVFYALALTQTALPTDKTYATQLKAAQILDPLFQAHPDHPGIAHYIIHNYDYPPLAEKALGAARLYASIAPAVPHALHMPSHTFTRVGLWKESVETNLKSADTAKNANSSGDELHALDYQTYAYLQTAQDAAARKAIGRAKQVMSSGEGATAGVAGAGSFALAAMPARYALERRAWAEALALPVLPANTPFTQAMTHFARALGAARSGNIAAVPAELAALAALRDKMTEMKDPYWPEQIDIQRRVAESWMHFAEGKRDAAIAALRAAADAEDATDKSAVTPGPLAPARELLGFMLLEAKMPKEALSAFEASSRKEPRRFLGTYGLAKAAAAAGDTARSRAAFKDLVAIAADADTERAELVEARKTASSSMKD